MMKREVGPPIDMDIIELIAARHRICSHENKLLFHQ